MRATVTEKRADPLYEVGDHPPAAEETLEGQVFQLIETTVYVKEEGSDFVVEIREGFDLML